jgi:dimethylhistidine N-methyltransferase
MDLLNTHYRQLENEPSILREVLAGLSHRPKRLPSKLLYDKKGSELFEKICTVDEYYPWKTEVDILKKFSLEMSELIGRNALIIEPGSGAGLKIRTLLKKIDHPLAYVPIEISPEILKRMALELKNEFKDLKVLPIEGDFWNDSLEINQFKNVKKVIFFPGSTIGNFDPTEALKLLKIFKALVGEAGGMLIGFDLKKDARIIEKAYNDTQGITAQFNLNILKRINQQANANFNLNNFTHHAFYNSELGRLEMHLISNIFHQVRVHETIFIFQKGESIHTENSYKYEINDFKTLANKAKLKVIKTWTDKDHKFCMAYLSA